MVVEMKTLKQSMYVIKHVNEWKGQEAAESATHLALKTPTMNCSSQSNCCQQLNLQTISLTLIDTINKSTIFDSNFMYDCDMEVKSNGTGHILGVGQINCKI
jgi:hypothetical protein